MPLKKVQAVSSNKPSKKSEVPTVEINIVRVITQESGTFIGEMVQKNGDSKHLVLNTDTGEVKIKASDVIENKGIVDVYNEADTRLKDAKAIVDALKPVINGIGIDEITRHNCSSPVSQWSSVKLQDTDGAVARVSNTSRYSAANGDLVSSIFEQLQAAAVAAAKTDEDKKAAKKKFDVNEYVQETTVATFDSKFFLDSNGNFSQERYDKLNAMMAKMAKELGTDNPMSTKVVVQPKPGFHEQRYAKFDAAANKAIHEVMPNVVSVKANA